MRYSEYICIKLKILVFFLFIICFNSYGEDTIIVFSSNNQNFKIGQQVMILEDPKGVYSINEIVNSDKFQKSNSLVPELGISSSYFWIKVIIQNLSDREVLYLDLSHPVMDEIEFFFQNEKDQYESLKAGEFLPFSKRFIQDPDFIFPLNIPPGETKTFFLKIRSRENIQLPLMLGDPLTIVETLKKKDLVTGIYLGIMVVMILYNFFIFFTVKDRSYLFYVIYIILVLLTQISLQGYTFQYLWPDFPWIARQSLFVFPALVGIAGIIFMKDFLKVKEYAPDWIKFSYIFYLSYIIWVTIGFTGNYLLCYRGIEITAMSVSMYMLLMPIKVYRKGYKPAMFFLIAWIVFLLGIVIFVSKDLGLLPYNNFTRYTMQAGSALETILLSFALADRIKILQREKELSQAQALAALQENERIVKEQNVMLEKKVDDRTRDLKKSNEELAIAIKELKETQSQLVQSEKMASLGQLTAGVAHEINNPINFVSSSIKPLRRDIKDIISVMDEFESLSKENFEEKIKQISSLKNNIDLPYVKEEIESLLKGIEEGAIRTSEIVKGLRTFSRIDEADLKRIDIHEGIDSTLILLTSMMHGRIVVEKDYGNIPLVECYAGKLNQVFMNILNNAIHAVLKKNPGGGEGRIWIRTSEQNNQVRISIKDNGTGMPNEVRKKIFDPFFTTKEVGEGTGLGLSIVYNIIDSHNGGIEVFTEEGVGTEFVITLPKLYSNN